MLRADRLDVDVVRHAARVLLTMASPRYEPAQVADWTGAADAVADLARHLAAGPATLNNAAYAARLAEELRSGHLATLDQPPGRRATLIGTLTAVARRGLDPDGPVNRLRLRVVVPDPALPADVQLRPLVDGGPVTARAFTRGQPGAPEELLGRLRAGTEPHEVMLAEAGCTEGCCGALRVTVDRDGDRVRWHRWRSPGRDDPLPAFRFDAGAYAAELDRVEHDHGWEWPARTLARLLRERLAAEPDLLGRCDCRLSRAHARASERDRVELSFLHPNRRIRQDLPFLQFRLTLRPAGHPADQATSFVERLRDTDPKHDAEIAGGSREYAEQLGVRWPQPRSRC
ncbi:hypothetical protein ACL02O_31455 [Micromonospora sp. MS34]|uniref:hypothetical protein n=1 Tax=Micromonospora sp. MS34 TaxID=3385971 RepID=UPI0039A33602